MKEAIIKLNKIQIDFICKECKITDKELMEMTEDTIYDKVYEEMCAIEIYEVCSNENDKDTERCELASDIVTILGNTLYN